jgi:hypothetical protein
MKKTLYIASVATVFAVLATALAAGAQTTTVSKSENSTSEQPMLQVGYAGKVLMRGTIASITSGGLTVTSWGGAWTVNVGTGVQVLPTAAGNDLTQFKVGDLVGVQGTVSQAANWTIDATLVRDWTYHTTITQERQTNIHSAEGTIKNGTARNYVGVASNVSGSSFTLAATDGGSSYTVNVASGAEVVNRSYLTLPLSSVSNGDNVRVWGVNASGTITAQVVRDISIPATSTSTSK